MESDLYRKAERRISDTPELEPYRSVLIEYDWPNWEEHIEWVATGDVEEILDWCWCVTREL